jgi:hypothetical protein
MRITINYLAVIGALLLCVNTLAAAATTDCPNVATFNNVAADAAARKLLERKVADDDDVAQVLYKRYLTKTIPAAFVENFFERTKNDISFGLVCLALGDQETKWSVSKMSSTKPNKDGTEDHGPLQLNDSNIKSEKFMNYFAPREKESYDLNNYYMLTCINYFSQLIKESNGDLLRTLRVYNGGYSVLRQPGSERWDNTTNYARLVLKKIEKRRTDFDNFSECNYDDTKDHLQRYFDTEYYNAAQQHDTFSLSRYTYFGNFSAKAIAMRRRMGEDLTQAEPAFIPSVENDYTEGFFELFGAIKDDTFIDPHN